MILFDVSFKYSSTWEQKFQDDEYDRIIALLAPASFDVFEMFYRIEKHIAGMFRFS